MQSTTTSDLRRTLVGSWPAKPHIWRQEIKWKGLQLGGGIILGAIQLCSCSGQSVSAQSTKENSQIKVNWLYGSFVPRDVPLEPLNGGLRWKLYLRQTYTTPGIYIKTALFTVHDQVHNTIPEWGGGVQGFATRFASRQGQFMVQNSISSLGFALVDWEPRYDRCRSDGFWPRARHAIARNFVTYDRTEKSLRPQIMLYLGAFAGSVVSATWKPGNVPLWTAGYQGAVAQVPIGIGTNFLGEFAPEIVRSLRRKGKQR
jgi:hypothetical protein